MTDQRIDLSPGRGLTPTVTVCGVRFEEVLDLFAARAWHRDTFSSFAGLCQMRTPRGVRERCHPRALQSTTRHSPRNQASSRFPPAPSASCSGSVCIRNAISELGPRHLPITTRLEALNVASTSAEIGRQENVDMWREGMQDLHADCGKYFLNAYLPVFPQKSIRCSRPGLHLPHNCFHAYSTRSRRRCHISQRIVLALPVTAQLSQYATSFSQPRFNFRTLMPPRRYLKTWWPLRARASF